MDEKLQVCFDLFDSEGRKALTLKDVSELCSVLFRVALAQGLQGTKTAKTDEHVIDRYLGDGLEPPQQMQDDSASTCSMVSLSMSTTCNASVNHTNTAGPSKVAAELSWSPRSSERPERASSAVHLVGTRKSDEGSSSQLYAARLSMGRSSNDVSNLDREDGAQQNSWEPWRSMLTRLLAAARVRTPGGQRLVGFEDFRQAAHMEPELLCLFAWCLPRPPETSGLTFAAASEERGWSVWACRCAMGWFFWGVDIVSSAVERPVKWAAGCACSLTTNLAGKLLPRFCVEVVARGLHAGLSYQQRLVHRWLAVRAWALRYPHLKAS
eukprot:TRINITY_DN114135_c0_g1_i1.p1 TRINITY_DN114135_c0_g1~~TRINITY_DN114135_c0_g1_i1.p1  ORF type:complete len:361 (+),score=57.64 TRINITY_DN114135_c0_g1_i1:112-1083(+)